MLFLFRMSHMGPIPFMKIISLYLSVALVSSNACFVSEEQEGQIFHYKGHAQIFRLHLKQKLKIVQKYVIFLCNHLVQQKKKSLCIKGISKKWETYISKCVVQCYKKY